MRHWKKLLFLKTKSIGNRDMLCGDAVLDFILLILIVRVMLSILPLVLVGGSSVRLKQVNNEFI